MAMPMYPSGAYAAPMRRPGIPGIAVNSASGTSPGIAVNSAPGTSAMPVQGAPSVPAEGPAQLAPTALSSPQGGQSLGVGQPSGGMPGATADFVKAEIARDRENPG